MNDLIRKTERYIKQQGMLEKGDGVVAAVSGGADSVCLLHVLASLKEAWDLKLYVVHVNHGIRGANADRDEAFVRRLAGEYGFPFFSFREDVPKLAEMKSLSVEEAGRLVRRDDCGKIMEQCGASKIATAHHMDDQAETVLLSLCRGSGLAGAAGIRPVSGPRIRPLLCLARSEIEEWLRENGFDWCHDESNDEDHYTRNRVRHHVLPYLSGEVNASSVRHIAAAAEDAREAEEYLEEQAGAALSKLKGACASEAPCDLPEGVLAEAKVLQPFMVRQAYGARAGSLRDLTRDHIAAVLALLEGGAGKSADLPGGMTAVKGYTGISFVPRPAAPVEETFVTAGEPLLPGGSVTLEGWTVSCETEDAVPCPVPQNTYTKWIDSGIIADSLCVRTRRKGDRLTVTDRGGSQSLSDYLTNEKIPRDLRAYLPLVADGNEIVWVIGKRLGAKYKITQQTKKALRLEARPAKVKNGEQPWKESV